MPILTSLALLLLLVGTYLLSLSVYVWDAALYLVVGLGCLTAIWLRRHPLGGRGITYVREAVPHSAGGWIRVAALFVSLAVALATRARPDGHDFTVPLIVWLIAVGGFALSLAVPLRGHALRGVRLTKPERWGLVALVIGAGLLRGVAVGRAPANLGGDEGSQLAAALDLVTRPLGNPFATGWYSVPTMSFLVYGVGMRIFGATVAGGRMTSVIAGTLTVVTTFLLARSVGGRRVGWVAAVALAGAAYHIHFSRLASNQIGDPLIGTVTLWLVWRALGLGQVAGGDRFGREHRNGLGDPLRREDGHDRSAAALWGLAGIGAGLGWYGYFGARWVVVLVALVVVWRAWVDRTLLRRHRAGLVLFAAGWLVTVAPLLGWYTLHGSSLTERYRAVSIFVSGWLSREVTTTGRSATQLMLLQLWKSVTAFHLTPDPTFWYRPDRPLVDFVSGAMMATGLVAALRPGPVAVQGLGAPVAVADDADGVGHHGEPAEQPARAVADRAGGPAGRVWRRVGVVAAGAADGRVRGAGHGGTDDDRDRERDVLFRPVRALPGLRQPDGAERDSFRQIQPGASRARLRPGARTARVTDASTSSGRRFCTGALGRWSSCFATSPARTSTGARCRSPSAARLALP